MKQLLSQLTALAAFMVQCHAATLSVSADANIFGAGHTTPPHPGGGGSGTLPPSYDFAAGPGKVLTFTSLTGRCTLTTGLGFHGPEGYPLPTDINSTGGISGLRHDREGFLVGVFLGPDESTSPAPPKLDFRASALGTRFATLSPLIGQTFCIAAPLAGTGALANQRFQIPPTATRLFLGFADAYTYTGDPGQYHDNAGALTATFKITAPPYVSTGPSPASATERSTLNGATAPGPELHAFSAIELRWDSETKRLYQVQWTPSLTQPRWMNLEPAVRPTGTNISIFDSTRERPQGFYRVQVVQ
jgi:hypothetical protein